MADDETLDQEIEPTPFLSKALIGRFLAVGVFVALGTFAVLQSVSGKKDLDEDHTGHDHALVAENSETDAAGKSDPSVTSSLKTGLAGFLKGNSSTEPAKPSTSRPAKPVVTKPAVRPSTSFPSSGGFSTASNPAKPSTIRKGFNALKTKTKAAVKPLVDPLVKKTAPSFNPSTSGLGLRPKSAPTPRPKPPERLAQAPRGGFMPTIGAQGFGASSPTVSDTVAKAKEKALGGFNAIGKSASNSFGDLKKSVGGSGNFGDLKKTVGDGANSLLEKADSTTRSGINTLTATGQSARRKFGDATGEKSPTSPSGSSRLGDHLSSRLNRSNSPSAARPTAVESDRLKSDPFKTNSFGQKKVTARPTAQRSSIDGPERPNRRLAQPTTRPTTPPATLARQSFAKPQDKTGDIGSTTRRAPSASAVTQLASSALTLSTPGERRLEGVQSPSLTIEKVSPREIQVDQPADFEIRVRNVGRVPADNVMVIDRVPSGTEFLGATPEAARSATSSGGLEWDIGTLEPGQEKRIRYQLKPTRPGEIGSVAQVVFATQASMRTVVTKPVLNIQHATSPKVLMGDNFVFDVIVENRGDGPATDVIIQEEVPEQLEYQAGFRQLEYEVGTLLPGQKRELRLALKAGKVGKFRNVMFATGKGGLEAKHALDLEVVAPELRVSSEGPHRRFLERLSTHQFTIENRGTAKATNVDLIARLPSGLKYKSSDNRGQYDAQSHAVYWKMPELASGVAGTVEVTTVPVSVGQQNIKFEADADLKLTAATEHKMMVEHLIDVFFDIDDVIDPIEVGSTTSYRMRILNQGTKAASNVQLQVDFPPGLTPESVDGNLRHQITGQRVVFEPIGSLPPGEELTMSVTARGKAPGDHRVVANSVRADGRDVAISKEDTTRVYSDR